MLDRFERFSFAISEISRCWRKLASEEMLKYGLKSPHATYLTTMYKYPNGLAILEEKGLVEKQSVDGSMYRGILVLTDEGKAAAEHVYKRASLAVDMAGKDLTDETRAIFYKALESIVSNLRELSRKGIPE